MLVRTDSFREFDRLAQQGRAAPEVAGPGATSTPMGLPLPVPPAPPGHATRWPRLRMI